METKIDFTVASVLDCKKGEDGKMVYFVKLSSRVDRWVIGKRLKNTTTVVPKGTQHYLKFDDAWRAFERILPWQPPKRRNKPLTATT